MGVMGRDSLAGDETLAAQIHERTLKMTRQEILGAVFYHRRMARLYLNELREHVA